MSKLNSIGVLGLVATLGLSPLSAWSQGNPLQPQLYLNQTGYHPSAAKPVIVDNIPEGVSPSFSIVEPTKRKVPILPLGLKMLDIQSPQPYTQFRRPAPGTANLWFDAAPLATSGKYAIDVNRTRVMDPPFIVSEFVFWDTLRPVLRSLYLIRAGERLDDPQTGIFRRAGHTEPAQLPESSPMEFSPLLGTLDSTDSLDVSGGWYTNGTDYNQSTTHTGLAISRILVPVLWKPKLFSPMKLDYPLSEKGQGDVPDIHHELRVGLNWLMAMQRPDGGVFDGVDVVQSDLETPPIVLPDQDQRPRKILPVTAQSTAVAVATWAEASRAYKQSDLGYAVRLTMHAEKGWNYLAKQPVKAADLPHRVWAATELYLTTGSAEYLKFVAQYGPVTPVSAIDTTNPWLIGAAHWLTSPHSKDLPQFSQTLQTQLLQQASSLVVSNPAEPKMQWLVRYGKASNRVILDDIALLLSAYRLTNDARYRDSAVARIHTLFGLNPLGQSYVTGIGTKPVSFPANMLVQATDKMIPGLLVDGPNANPSDGLTPSGIGASSYADRYKATSSNATSLLNTAALAQALGMLNVSFGNTQSNIKE